MTNKDANKVKQYPFRFKLRLTGIEWGQSEITLGSKTYFYYFYWWNWVPKELRYLGFEQIYYDGPHNSFGFWFFNISWSTPLTRVIQDN